MSEPEVLEVDVLVVGAGPAGLSAALRIAQLNRRYNRQIPVMVIDKASDRGGHQLSGAVMDPAGMDELLPDWRERGAPVEAYAEEEFVWYLNEHDAISMPVPPPLRNEGKPILSLCKFTRWLGEQVESAGVDLFTGFPGERLLIEDGRVAGVKLKDKGIGKEGKPRPNFEPGGEIRAKVTILAEGVLGTLTREAVRIFRLDEGRNPQTFSTGVKEVWKLPDGRVPPGRVIHTMGFPLNSEYGGSWIYTLAGNKVSMGLVVGLDYQDPFLDIHRLFQEFKQHPKIRDLLEGGELLEYGAKTIPSGGPFSIPRLFAPGLLLAGDSAGFVNMMRLKGIHLAIKTGMLAGESAFKHIYANEDLAGYERAVRNSWAWQELYRTRYYKQGFKLGLVPGILNAGLMQVTGGWSPVGRKLGPAHTRMKKKGSRTPPGPFKGDGKLTFDKLTSVYHSDTHHDEDCPSHLIIKDPAVCVDRCKEEFGNPCRYFCPAQVYEWVEDEQSPRGRVQIGFGNCVHCKTCDIKDPYGIIEWVVPEGEGGPHWKEL